MAAIEIYNKPDFLYREETFAILMVNAWELALKAQILQLNSNKLTSLYRREKRRKKDGSRTKRRYTKINRAGNPVTVGLYPAASQLKAVGYGLDRRCLENITLLVEIRDNAVHLFNKSFGLKARLRGIGMAALRNYVAQVQEWFNYDLTKFDFYLMPLSFFQPSAMGGNLSLETLNPQSRNLLEYLRRRESAFPSEESQTYNVALHLEPHLVQTPTADVLPVQIVQAGEPRSIAISEDQVLEEFCLRYRDLTNELRARYSDFSENQRFHDLRRELEGDPRYCFERVWDPSSPRSSKLKFYSRAIFRGFDGEYTLRTNE